jgi:cellulose biosynthesis protein BcsQ
VDVLWAFISKASEVVSALLAVWGVYQFLKNRRLKRRLDTIEKAMQKGEDQPWLLQDPPKRLKSNKPWSRSKKQPDPDERDTKYLCIYNQKGGVGKTMFAMNLAAYLDRKGKDVLLLDMDYQGSLSSAMLAACEITEVPSQMNDVFEKNEKPDDVIDQAISLQWTRSILEQDREEKLPHTKIITAHYPFLKVENRLTLRWLVDDKCYDVRFRAHNVVRSRAVRKNFDVVIFDCPPRLTMGTVNALCASTHLLIPTILDSQSARPVGLTLDSITELKRKLNDKLRLLGVVGNRNSNTEDTLSDAEEEALNTIRQSLAENDTWGHGCIFKKTIPRRAAIINNVGEDVPYLANRRFRELFDELGRQIMDALYPKDCSGEKSNGQESEK